MYAVKWIDTILTVPSVEDTVAWYQRVLGWDGGYDVVDAQGHWLFGAVTFGAVEGMSRGEQPLGGFNLLRAPEGNRPDHSEHPDFTALMSVDDVEAAYATVIAHGVIPDAPPSDQFWRARTFSMRDLNGYRLMFAQEIEALTLDDIRSRHEQMQVER